MNSTVFILGAGSSIPFGYPSGPKLVDLILDSLNPNYFHLLYFKAKESGTNTVKIYQNKQSYTDYSLFIKHGFSPKFISEFEIALRNSNKDSIDSFILDRNEFYEIGKFAIANCILRCEIPTEIQFVQKNWLSYLWNKINITRSIFSAYDISFITFNYDRILEYYFYNSLKYSFNLSDQEIIRTIKPILHMHGVVGDFTWQNLKDGFDYNFSGQDFNSHYLRVVNASKKIKIIYEKFDKKDIFEQVYDCMSSNQSAPFNVLN